MRRSRGQAGLGGELTDMEMKVVQACVGRFHHFDLAKQLHHAGVLERFFTGYPMFKVRSENLPVERITSFPWVMVPRMIAAKRGMLPARFGDVLHRWAQETLDSYVAANLPECDILLALSGAGLRAGSRAQARGGKFICDRGSTHIRFQDSMMREEFARWGEQFHGIDPRIMAKEEEEYEAADVIMVPSEFVYRTFVEMGTPAVKLQKLPYGVDLDRFEKVGVPDKNWFDVLFVGQVSFRKGVPDLLDAFRRLAHPRKRLRLVGTVKPEMRRYLNKHPPAANVDILGHVPQPLLKHLMSRSHVMVLPSVEEGLALVQAQAMACGCPVIATRNTGAEDLYRNGVEGFIVPPRDPLAVAECLQVIAEDDVMRTRMSENALRRVEMIGGWDEYGSAIKLAMSRVLTEGSGNAAMRNMNAPVARGCGGGA